MAITLRDLNRIWVLIAIALIAAALILLSTTNAVLVIGGALALVAILRVPELALYALVFAVPYGSLLPISFGVGNLTVVDLLVVVVLVLWFARMIAKDRAIVIRFPPLTIPFAFFLFTAFVSMTGASSLQFALKELAKFAEMFAMYLFVANNLDKSSMTRVLIAMMLAGISEATIGMYQFIFKVGPDGFLLFDRFIRAFGTFEQPNPYAGYLGLVIPIALGILLGVWNGLRPDGKDQIAKSQSLATNAKGNFATQLLYAVRYSPFAMLAFVTLLATTVALGMSWSRGAWIGVGAGLVVTIVVQSKRAFVLTLVGAGLLAFAIWLSSINIIPNAIAARFSGVEEYFGVFDVRGVQVDDANFALVERMAHWQAAFEMFQNHPAFGVGFGNYQVAYPDYALPHWSDPLGHAHNYYLNVAAEAGALGLIAYMVLWLAAIVQGWRGVRLARGLWRGIAAGMLGVLIALSIQNGLDDLFVHGMHVQIGIIIGMMGATLAPPAQLHRTVPHDAAVHVRTDATDWNVANAK